MNRQIGRRGVLAALAMVPVAAFLAPSVGATCDVVRTYTKTADFHNADVEIDFESNGEVDVNGVGRWRIESINYRVTNSGPHNLSWPVGDGLGEVDVKPAGGARVKSIQVVVKHICPPQPTPTPTPSPTPSPTPDPGPVTLIVPAPGVRWSPNCSLDDWRAGNAHPACSPWQVLEFTVLASSAIYAPITNTVISGVTQDGQVLDWFALPSSAVGYVAYSPAFQAGQQWTGRMEVGAPINRAGELHILPNDDDYGSTGEIRGEDHDTQNAQSTDPVGGDWMGPGADVVITWRIVQIPQG